MDLTGAPIVVTGAAGEIARTVAAMLADAGARLFLMDRDAERLAAASSTLGAACVGVHAGDLSDEADSATAFSAAAAALGGAPHALVHLAGLISSRPLINLLSRDERRHPFALWRTVVGANLDTAFLAGAFAAEQMATSRTKGALVLISSVAAQGNAGQSAYAAAKAGVDALVKVWARELGPLGIRAVAIAPGFVDTPTTHAALGEKAVDAKVKATPLRRLCRPEAIGQAVRFALENDDITGTVVRVDGGIDG